MPRPRKIWFRKDTGWWMVTIGGKKVRLAQGRSNRDSAEKKFHELALTEHIAPESSAARVADLVEAFLEYAHRHWAPDTYRNYRFYGQKFAEAVGSLTVAGLKPYHVSKWADRQQWNTTTRRNAMRIARRVMAWSKEQGLVTENPLSGLKLPPGLARKRAMTEAEFRTIIAASHGPLRVFFWTLRQTGARPSELRRLTWDEVHGDRWIIPEHKTAKKTRRARVIYLTPPVAKLIEKLQARSRSRYVFVSRRGVPWTVNALRLALGRIKKKHGLAADLCCYLVRHTFGTFAVMNGLSSSEVAELMGHTSTEMVDRVYVHLADQVSHLRDAVVRATRQRGDRPG